MKKKIIKVILIIIVAWLGLNVIILAIGALMPDDSDSANNISSSTNDFSASSENDDEIGDSNISDDEESNLKIKTLWSWMDNDELQRVVYTFVSNDFQYAGGRVIDFQTIDAFKVVDKDSGSTNNVYFFAMECTAVNGFGTEKKMYYAGSIINPEYDSKEKMCKMDGLNKQSFLDFNTAKEYAKIEAEALRNKAK